MTARRLTRRHLLGTLASATLVGGAGCLGSGTDSKAGQSSDESTGLSVGERPPDFSLDAVGGKTVSLRPVEKPTVLFFMAAWCSSCKEESHSLKQIHEQYGNQVRLISIDADPQSDSMGDLRTFKQQYAGDWSHVMGTAQVIGDYKFNSMDTTSLLNSQGITQYKATDVTSVATFKEELEKLLGSGETA